MNLRILSYLMLLTMLTGLVAGCAQPVPMAPAESAAPAASSGADASQAAPGEIQPGGTWTRSTSADASIINPILSSDSASSAVEAMLFPGLIGQDHSTGAFVPDGSMSESWSVSDDGLTWTFKLRDGVTWSDGDAVASDLVETVRKSLVEPIASITVIDPLTIEVKFKEVRCDAISNLGLGWLPSHLYAADFSDIMTSPLNDQPAVSAGPFTFQSWTRDDNTILVRNENYWEGAPYMDGMIYRIVPDAGTRLAQLQSGEVDIVGIEPTQLTAVQGNPDIDVYRFEDDGYDYIALNQANPENPQPGKDENGNLLPQDPHPILGDVAVRQAMAHALDYQSIIDNVYLGQGYQIAANVLPAISWAYDDALAPYDYNPDLARQMLEDAGWVDGNNDGIREKDGKTLSLSLLTNAGNKTREDLGVLVQDQLNAIGFDISFEAIDFGTMVDRMLGQNYDMVIIGWTGLGSDPNDDAFWKSDYDTPGSGFNFVSFQSARIDELLTQGVTVPGCAPEARAPIYKEIQQIIHDQVPYIFLSGGVGNTGYRNNWGNVDPGPWSFYWNVHQWYNKSLQP